MKTSTFPPLHRALHWLIALALILMLLTIFLRQNWMNKYHVAEILTEQLSELDVSLSDDQAVLIAKKVRKPMWDWHIYIGYVLGGLYLVRMIYFAVKKKLFANPFSKESTAKEKFQALVYLLFYLLLGFSLITGVLIVLGPKEYKHSLESVHILSHYWLVGYIVLHFAGLIFAELGDKKGIIGKMIYGNNE